MLVAGDGLARVRAGTCPRAAGRREAQQRGHHAIIRAPRGTRRRELPADQDPKDQPSSQTRLVEANWTQVPRRRWLPSEEALWRSRSPRRSRTRRRTEGRGARDRLDARAPTARTRCAPAGTHACTIAEIAKAHDERPPHLPGHEHGVPKAVADREKRRPSWSWSVPPRGIAELELPRVWPAPSEAGRRRRGGQLQCLLDRVPAGEGEGQPAANESPHP